MTCRSAIEQPDRFARFWAVGAHFGLTLKKYRSGEIDRTGRISKVGDAMVRTALFEAANVMLTRACAAGGFKAWALRVVSQHCIP
jgi:transposase